MFLIKNKINIYLYFFFLLFILVFIKFSTTIVFADNYIVKNIKIKEQYDINFNKDEVINKGFKKGFKTLIFRIVENKDKNLFKDIPNNKISSLIDNFSITNEKFVDNNYEVDFEVKFDKKKLLSFIRGKNVISSVPKDTDVLFIPILIDTQSNEIKFFDQNYFYNNWNNVNKNYFLLNYNLPDENIENFRLFQRIKNNIEKIFKVNVTKVNIINKQSRTKLTRGRKVKVSGFKKAIITLKKGQSIDLTTGI